MGIRAVIFDFDGVLAVHGAISISPIVSCWLKAFIQNYTGQIFLLSNNLFKNRVDYLSTNWPEIQIVTPKKKKPDPDGILEITRITGLLPQKILMIDDRLSTGLLAARLAGINGLLVNPALVNYKAQPIIEMFFASLRLLERFICLI
jgi:predicted HAD superfamily phosphohydrolase YqeG